MNDFFIKLLDDNQYKQAINLLINSFSENETNILKILLQNNNFLDKGSQKTVFKYVESVYKFMIVPSISILREQLLRNILLNLIFDRQYDEQIFFIKPVYLNKYAFFILITKQKYIENKNVLLKDVYMFLTQLKMKFKFSRFNKDSNNYKLCAYINCNKLFYTDYFLTRLKNNKTYQNDILRHIEKFKNHILEIYDISNENITIYNDKIYLYDASVRLFK